MMTLLEASKRFDLSYETLKQYTKMKFIVPDSPDDYSERDFENVGIIDLLIGIGFEQHEVIKYLSTSNSEEQRINMLKTHRKQLLNDIHDKQKLLDSVDHIIWNLNKKEKRL